MRYAKLKNNTVVGLIIILTLLTTICVYMQSTNVQFVNFKNVVSMHYSNFIAGVMEEKHLFQNESQCSDLDYINSTIAKQNDLEHFVNMCEKRNTSKDNSTVFNVCEYCSSTNPTFLTERKPLVALASFPGSGNSWTRELLESLTGVYTGSVYPDVYGSFPGSKQCPSRGKVFIVKTHMDSYNTRHSDCRITRAPSLRYEKAMYILRNPYEAMMSTYNLGRTGSKVKFASRDNFKSLRWNMFVTKWSKNWKEITTFWLTTYKNPTHVIVYENLTKNTIQELNDIGRFLSIQPTYLDLYCAKHCSKVKYYRINKPSWMNKETVYDKRLKEVVNAEIKTVMKNIEEMDDIVQHLNSYIL